MTEKIALQTCVVDNYGGLLQAYALKMAIESLGFQCDVLPFLRYGNSGTSLKKTLISIRKRLLSRRGTRSSNVVLREKHIKFDCFRRDYLGLKKTLTRNKQFYLKLNKRYHTFVCGSDLIWNPYLRPDNLWFDMLAFASPDSLKIAYAPSIGVPAFPPEIVEEIGGYLSSFDFLSCREDEGVELIKKAFGLPVKHVLDPTLLLGKNFWLSFIDGTVTKRTNYCFMYVFDEEPIDDIVRKILDETDLNIFISSFENLKDDGLKSNDRVNLVEAGCGPVGFVGYIANATFVICNSFHGMAFSINLNTPFMVFLRKDNGTHSVNSRLRSLSRMFNMESRLLPRDIDLGSVHLKDYLEQDFEKSNLTLTKERNNSFDFLRTALYGHEHQ